MKKTLRSIGFAVCYIYLGVTFLATPYFNWRYAVEHGFGSWLFFGEVIATAKAAIWPYYALVPSARRGSVEAYTDLHFANSRRASHEALSVISRFGGITELPPKEASDVVRLLQASVTEAELVDDSYLQQVHPEFLRRFRDEYTGSLGELADGIRTGDQAKEISGAANYNSFSEWVSTHAKELNFQ